MALGLGLVMDGHLRSVSPLTFFVGQCQRDGWLERPLALFCVSIIEACRGAAPLLSPCPVACTDES